MGRITLDYRSKEPDTPVTPEVGKEFPCASPPTTKFLDNLDVKSEAFVTFYIRSSTTGQRGIVIKASYKILDQEKHFNCHVDEKLELETVEPFLISSELLSCRNQQKMQTAYSDEPFLLLPELKSLSNHALRIFDTSVELRPPLNKVGNQPSQLQNCTMYQESIANECFALKVNLASSSLDVQDLALGKYVVRWVREEYLTNDKVDPELLATSNYDLQSVKVCQGSLYVEAKIPAYAVARVPFGVIFKLVNRTDIVLEFNLTMESSEAFMLSGNKQQHFKIPPGSASHDLHYVFYPLLAGDSVPLPKPKLSSMRPALPHDDVSATLERLLPTSILVLPRSRGKYSPSVEKKNPGKDVKEQPFYEVNPSVFVPRVPFVKPRV